MKDLNISLKDLKEDKRRNFEERLRFIDQWVDCIKTHSDEEWSNQQKALINSHVAGAKQYPFTKEEYLQIKAQVRNRK